MQGCCLANGNPASTSWRGAVFLLAGVYQLTPLKQGLACGASIADQGSSSEPHLAGRERSAPSVWGCGMGFLGPRCCWAMMAPGCRRRPDDVHLIAALAIFVPLRKKVGSVRRPAREGRVGVALNSLGGYGC